ncbi:ATP-dependent helicase HrpA [Mycobacteroides abscessus subsp. abscessus]|nr:ATP-dependent helicase HrpA [Mycobacteroides abscessus subsp. abscessus]
MAIRLFSQADYLSRPRFTEPEILRTSLASVILQMASLGLGAVEDFPFLDAPDRRAVRDGVALLVEIGALAQDRESADAAPASSQYRLTGIGRDLARLPIDPRLGRMLLEAERLGCASEVLVIVAALSIQDVRERPAEHQGTADASHARLADPHSDFITYLNLWRYLAVQARDLSGSAFRRMCRAEFFHYLRWREWRDVVGQLRQMARALGIAAGPVGEPSTGDVVEAAQFGGAQDAAVRAVLAYGQGTASVDADQVHRSLLVGLLSYLGSWDETKRDYEGARGTHFTIWPGSGVSGHPAWVMTAELVETSRLFARTVARIRPEWVEPAARGLLKRSYSEPFWSVAKGAAMVRERVTLYGLTLAADREVLLGRLGDLVIDEAVAASRSHAPRAGSLEALAAGLVSASKDPLSSGSFEPRHFEELAAAREGTTARELAREMFIRNALVDGQWRERHAFQRRNEALVEQAREVERRSRTHGLVADEQARFRFFDDLIPEHVTSAAAFNRWWKDERREHPDLLIYPASLLMPREATSGEGFPDRWQCGDLSLALSYEFAPGSPRDGVSMRIPIEVLERVSDAGTDWLVPGMREDLLTEAIRALPKGVRRLLAPAPDVAASVARWIEQAGDEPVEAVVASADESADKAKAAESDEPDPLSLDAAMGRLAAWGATSGKLSTRNSPAKAPKKAAQKETPAAESTQQGAPAAEAPKPRPLTEGPILDALAHAVRVLRGVDLSEADLAHARAHLPDHLRMTFVVTDASGKELGAGKDLAYLQRSLASDANKAVRTAVRAALEEAGERQARRNKRGRGASEKATARGGEDSSTSASASNGGAQSAPGDTKAPKDAQASAPAPDPAFHADGVTQIPTLPRSITQTSGTMTLRAFPALVPQGSAAAPAAGVRVMASAAEADREHRAGLARLLLSRIALATNRVTTRWTGREALMLAASPYADTAALVADAQLASALALVGELSTPADVRDPEAFETLVAAARDAHEDRVYQILSHVVRALEASAEADAAVRSHPQASLEETTRDVAAHGKTLLYEGFVSATPASALPHLARYLRAGAVRIERAASSPGALARDLEDMDRIHQAEAEIAATREALERRPYDARRDAALTQARWMAEELRVSMFAQTLGTPNKVSMKRLLGVLAGAR